MKNSIYLSSILCFLAACSDGPKQENTSLPQAQTSSVYARIDRPVAAVSPGKASFSFSNEQGRVMKTLKGSLIAIPEHAFVDAQGLPVKGEVTVEITELFNPAEIILSGIPMHADNNGVATPFVSDGMFKITAGCNGKQVGLAPGKEIAVATPSYKEDEDFDLWYFNETSGVWENEGKRNSTLEENDVMKQALAVNAEQTRAFQNSNVKQVSPQPSNPVKASGSESQVPLKKPLPLAQSDESDFVFTLKVNKNTYPELETYKNTVWKPNAPLSKKQEAELLSGLQADGANIRLECTDIDDQQYTISYGNKAIEARPVYVGADKEKAKKLYAERVKRYEAALKAQEEMIKNRQAAGQQYSKTFTLFSVAQMGIFNCDRFYSYKGQKGNYTFLIGDTKIDQYVFAVLSKNQGVISLSAAYKVDDYYTLPSAEIIGFVYTKHNGEVYAAKQSRDAVKPYNDIQFTLRRKDLNSPSELQSILEEFN